MTGTPVTVTGHYIKNNIYGGCMKAKMISGLAVIIFLPFMALAQDSPKINVEDIQICTSIQDRQPVGADTSFAGDIGQLYCFTKLSADQDSTTIFHAWYYNDKEMNKVELGVKAKTWRTWSNKKIMDTWTGNWRVDVLSSDGNVLGSIEFTIR
jgi:hypothetical protein